MNLNIENIVRSAAIVAVGLPFSLSITNLTNTTAAVAELALKKNPQTEVVEQLQADLTKPCIDFYLSKQDSKLERTAKNDIDEIMGGDVSHRALCDYIIR